MFKNAMVCCGWKHQISVPKIKSFGVQNLKCIIQNLTPEFWGQNPMKKTCFIVLFQFHTAI